MYKKLLEAGITIEEMEAIHRRSDFCNVEMINLNNELHFKSPISDSIVSAETFIINVLPEVLETRIAKLTNSKEDPILLDVFKKDLEIIRLAADKMKAYLNKVA